jgi:hypothetical protein
MNAPAPPLGSRTRPAGPAASPLSLHRNPLRQAWAASTWRAAWYLLVYQVTGWLLLGAALAAACGALALALTLVGLPVLVAVAGFLHRCADVERARLRWVFGQPVASRYRRPAAPSMMARAGARWKDVATWREFVYLTGLFVPLVIVGGLVLTVWLTLALGVTLPLWYWAPVEHYPHGLAVHGVQLGYFPNGPSGPGAAGVYIDTLPRALLAAVASLVLFAAFSYVLVLTARTHASIARALLRPPEDPLAAAKDLLERPGPLPPIFSRTDRASSPAHEGPAHGRGAEPTARTS